MCSNPHLLLQLLEHHMRHSWDVTRQKILKQRAAFWLAHEEYNHLLGLGIQHAESDRNAMLAMEKRRIEKAMLRDLNAEIIEIANTLAHLATLRQGMIH